VVDLEVAWGGEPLRDDDLLAADELGGLVRGRSRAAVAPEPLLGGRVDAIDQVGELRTASPAARTFIDFVRRETGTARPPREVEA
jgi:hypothetical protein